MMMSERMTDLVALVRSARDIARDERNMDARMDKGEFDYATQADLKVQAYLEAALKAREPAYQFLGEEQASGALDLDRPTWILDPIDGTTNLMHRFPQSAIALGLMIGREIVLGIVYNPFLDHLFTAEKGKGAWMNGKRLRVSSVETLHESLIFTGTSPYTKQHARADFALISELFTRCQDIRRIGSAALEISYVACGFGECFYERSLKLWDYAAAKLIVEEAGGRMTTFTGGPVPVGEPSALLITNGRIHEDMLFYTRRMTP